MSLYQGILFHLGHFYRQSVVLSGNNVPLEYFIRISCHLFREFVPPDGFSQTRCRGMYIDLIEFLTQSVTILGELAPIKNTFTDKLSNPFTYCFEYIQ